MGYEIYDEINKNRYNVPAKSTPKREAEIIVETLKEVLETASMKTANFNTIGEKTKINGKTPDEFIKERTKLWRKTWIVAPLELLIERYEQILKGEK